MAGFVEDPVPAQLTEAEPERLEDGFQHGVRDWRARVVGVGHPGEQEMRVSAAGPETVAFARPPDSEVVGEFVEVDGVVLAAGAADETGRGRPAAGGPFPACRARGW